MKAGWHILNYHDINYEDSILTRAIGGTVRPDVFYSHVQDLSKHGDFISVEQGIKLLNSNENFTKPLFTIWFDDGFYGLKQHALKICKQFEILPVVSLCSRFVLQQEMFWRCKMSALVHLDGMRFLRTELRKHYDSVPFKLRYWTLENFDPKIVQLIDEIYNEVTSRQFRDDAFRVFLNEDNIKSLARHGWSLTNHTASHYPLASTVDDTFIVNQFQECEDYISSFDNYFDSWVIPFGFGVSNFSNLLDNSKKLIVHVDHKYNTKNTWDNKNIYRYVVPNNKNILNSIK